MRASGASQPRCSSRSHLGQQFTAKQRIQEHQIELAGPAASFYRIGLDHLSLALNRVSRFSWAIGGPVHFDQGDLLGVARHASSPRPPLPANRSRQRVPRT